jgi:hypothetical protein
MPVPQMPNQKSKQAGCLFHKSQITNQNRQDACSTNAKSKIRTGRMPVPQMPNNKSEQAGCLFHKCQIKISLNFLLPLQKD